MNLNLEELETILIGLDALESNTDLMILKNFIGDIVLTIEDRMAEIKGE